MEENRELRLTEQAGHLLRRGEGARDQRGDGVEGALESLAAARDEVTLLVNQECAARLGELEEGVELGIEALDVVLVEDETLGTQDFVGVHRVPG